MITAWVLSTGSALGRDRPNADAQDEPFRRLVVGTWQDEYQGKRTMRLREDGTGKMVVELDGRRSTTGDACGTLDSPWTKRMPSRCEYGTDCDFVADLAGIESR